MAKSVMMKLPQEVADSIRRNYGLEAGNTCSDDELSKLSADELFERYLRWQGLLGGWGRQLISALDAIRAAKRKPTRKPAPEPEERTTKL